jgi:hypothetical protein
MGRLGLRACGDRSLRCWASFVVFFHQPLAYALCCVNRPPATALSPARARAVQSRPRVTLSPSAGTPLKGNPMPAAAHRASGVSYIVERAILLSRRRIRHRIRDTRRRITAQWCVFPNLHHQRPEEVDVATNSKDHPSPLANDDSWPSHSPGRYDLIWIKPSSFHSTFETFLCANQMSSP